VAEHTLGLAAAQDAGIVDRVTTHKRRVNERQQLAPGPGRARALTEVERLLDDPLDPELIGERTREHEARVCDRMLVVEGKHEPVQPILATPAAAPLSRHHVGDLLSAGLAAARTARLACSGGHFARHVGRRPAEKTVD